jgi:hypothetical protein
MQYIEESQPVDIKTLCDTLDKFKNIPTHTADFDTYVDRVKNHWYSNWPDKEIDWTWLEDISEVCNTNYSFCHGDASIDNFINYWNEIYMIDPIYEKELWSSWLIDISKLLMSLKRFDNMGAYEYVKLRYKKYPLHELELTHWIRFYKYTDKPNECMERINELINNR